MSRPEIPGRLNQEDPALSDRQRRVFASLLTVHAETGRPVGSQALGSRAGIPLSPASIRGALAELEGLGLIERAHASAGRVPSSRGYRLFVRTLLTPAPLPPDQLSEVDRTLRAAARDVEHLLSQASRLLSQLTRQLGLAQAASLDHETLQALDLSPLDQRRLLLVLRLGGLALKTLSLELESPLEDADVASVESVLRERLLGRALHEVRARLDQDPDLVRHSAVRMVARAAAACWADPVSTPLYSSGAAHIAGQPEFADTEQLRQLLEVLESGVPLDRLMVASGEGVAAIRVGLDEDRALAGCSLVSYVLPGDVHGAVGVLGPLRMDYGLAVAVVDAVGSRVAELIRS
ncbi:MAG TPA: heat-inducible transcriptional repressor HrcA [Candidatus Sulfotelmatobacter sp.]|nr:heat-inducible transcriptional repressor HrcA [Candidatus Sulfotelmatobacter sp.]